MDPHGAGSDGTEQRESKRRWRLSVLHRFPSPLVSSGGSPPGPGLFAHVPHGHRTVRIRSSVFATLAEAEADEAAAPVVHLLLGRGSGERLQITRAVPEFDIPRGQPLGLHLRQRGLADDWRRIIEPRCTRWLNDRGSYPSLLILEDPEEGWEVVLARASSGGGFSQVDVEEYAVEPFRGWLAGFTGSHARPLGLRAPWLFGRLRGAGAARAQNARFRGAPIVDPVWQIRRLQRLSLILAIACALGLAGAAVLGYMAFPPPESSGSAEIVEEPGDAPVGTTPAAAGLTPVSSPAPSEATPAVATQTLDVADWAFALAEGTGLVGKQLHLKGATKPRISGGEGLRCLYIQLAVKDLSGNPGYGVDMACGEQTNRWVVDLAQKAGLLDPSTEPELWRLYQELDKANHGEGARAAVAVLAEIDVEEVKQHPELADRLVRHWVAQRKASRPAP